jgi:uncharacterized membrane-anchored protein YjiN (DUF445 family)
MTGIDYKKALESAVYELESMLLEQEKIAERILSLRKTVAALSTLCEESGEPMNWREHASARLLETLEGSTITEDVLQAVTNAAFPISTTLIKEELEKIGTLDQHKNPLATINAVLNRLKEQGKVQEIVSGTKKLWKKSEPPRPVTKAPRPPSQVR